MKEFLSKPFIFFLIITFYLYITSPPVHAFSPTSDDLIAGIDVSFWQGDISFSEVASAGIDVVYIKASEGLEYVDPKFEQNYQDAKSAGLKVGFYHYVTSRTVENAIQQADFFAYTIAGKAPDCKLAMDFESFGSLSSFEINQIALAFMKELELQSGKSAILYSNTYTARTIFDSTVSEYPLWVANYDVAAPPANGTWSTWVGWQYTDQGEIPGISSYVDCDWFTREVFLGDSSPITEIPYQNMYPDSNSSSYIRYQIKWGDTLSKIAIEYGTTVQQLVGINHISNPNLIYTGDILLVPADNIKSTSQSNQLNTGKIIQYIVRSGDTLSQLAQEYHTTVSSLVSINHIANENLIYVGQKLYIPTHNYDMSHSIYVVKSGDTLWSISRRFGISVARIVMLNRITNPNLIYPGNVLRIG